MCASNTRVTEAMEKLDNTFCKKLARYCDLETVTLVTRKVQKQKANGSPERFGQWAKAISRICDAKETGNILRATAAAHGQGESPSDDKEGGDDVHA